MRAVVVDKRPEHIRLISEALRQEGFDVLPTGRPEQGLRMIRTQSPDIIIADLHCEIEGEELLTLVKGDAATVNIPYVVVTAWAQDADVAFVQDMKATFIPKPFNPLELRRKARALVS